MTIPPIQNRCCCCKECKFLLSRGTRRSGNKYGCWYEAYMGGAPTPPIAPYRILAYNVIPGSIIEIPGIKEWRAREISELINRYQDAEYAHSNKNKADMDEQYQKLLAFTTWWNKWGRYTRTTRLLYYCDAFIRIG